MILIVGKSTKKSRTIAELFNYMGVLSRTATPDQAIAEVSNRFRAILFTSVDNIHNHDDLIANLRRYSLGAPIFAMSESTDAASGKSDPILSKFDGIFYDNAYSSTVLCAIAEHQMKNRLPILGEYTISGIDASVFSEFATYYDNEIKFSKTELMILRYLIRSYPNPVKSADILKYAFNPSKMPDSSCVKTHVSIMNKKFKSAFGKNLATFIPGGGYIILTPEISEQNKK